jgi:hypothetical protein
MFDGIPEVSQYKRPSTVSDRSDASSFEDSDIESQVSLAIQEPLPVPTFGMLKRKVTAKRSKLALNSPQATQKPNLAAEIVQYRETAARSSNPEIQMEFAVFCIESSNSAEDLEDKSTYLLEGFAWLKRLSSAGYTEAQFYLGNAYRDDEQYERAYTQYSLAAKKLHAGISFTRLTNSRGWLLRGISKGERSGNKKGLERSIGTV